MLNYCLTSNHTHLLLMVHRSASISVFMRHLEGEFAASYNRRKRRRGAFWSERYHATLIEDGSHLWNCMRYIDLNMVRAGVVDHPIDWPWCGYQEITGHRRRYRILDLDELLRMEGLNDLGDFAEWYGAGLNEAIRAGRSRFREPHWTESIAVGSEAFVRRIAALAKNRKKLIIKECVDAGWYVCDPAECYSARNDEPEWRGPLE
jgi:putative transposase